MDTVVLFRIAERLTLTAVVLLVALVVMVGFWRSVQKIDLKEGGGLGIVGSFVFSTPVFVLLAIIGYAWVSLEHPIRVGPGGGEIGSSGEELASAGPPGGFVGIGRETDAEEPDAHDLAVAQRQIRSLNCLARDRELSNRTATDLAAVKLDLMQPHWQDAWGDAESFADWATGRSDAAPNPEARAFWEEVHLLC